MTGAVVPDASVAVKWLLEEAGSDRAREWLRTAGAICAPELLRVEAAAAIARRFRTGSIGEDDAKERLASCFSLLSERRVRYVSDRSLLEEAARIAVQIRHNLQDCMYIACASRVDAVLVTADTTLLERAARFEFMRAL